MRRIGWLCAFVLLLVIDRAKADTSRAWTVAKANLPAEAKLVVGLDMGTFHSTKLFMNVWRVLRSRGQPEIFDLIRTFCKRDPFAVMNSIVIGATDRTDGAVFIALNHFDKIRLAECAKALVQTPEGSRLFVHNNKQITEITKDGETAFLGWPADDVIVVPFQIQDRKSLLKWIGGRDTLSRSSLGSSLAHVDARATIWAAAQVEQEILPDILPGVRVKRMYGAMTYHGEAVALDSHVVLSSATGADVVSNLMIRYIDNMTRGPWSTAADVLRAIKVASRNDEVVLEANIHEPELMKLVALMSPILAGNDKE